MSKSIREWMKEIAAWGVSKGWDEPLCEERATPYEGSSGKVIPLAPKGVNVYTVLAKIALAHSELSEAVEAARDNHWLMRTVEGKDGVFKPEGFVVELADTVIRIFHIAEQLGLDLEGAIEAKMEYNHTRPHRHGGRGA